MRAMRDSWASAEASAKPCSKCGAHWCRRTVTIFSDPRCGSAICIAEYAASCVKRGLKPLKGVPAQASSRSRTAYRCRQR
jgi:hypothetical protein